MTRNNIVGLSNKMFKKCCQNKVQKFKGRKLMWPGVHKSIVYNPYYCLVTQLIKFEVKRRRNAFILENLDNFVVLILEIYIKIIPSQSDLDSKDKILYRLVSSIGYASAFS